MIPLVKATAMGMIEYKQSSEPLPPVPPSRTDAERARGVALRLLSLRSRTVAEMRERLSQRFGSEAVERTVARLQAEGLLNDAEFARQWRDSRERRKPRSPRMIERELKDRGVAGDLISDTLEDFDSHAAAHRAAARYAARQPVSDRAAFDRRVGAFLARRGFEAAIIRQTLHQFREELGIAGFDAGGADLAEE